MLEESGPEWLSAEVKTGVSSYDICNVWSINLNLNPCDFLGRMWNCGCVEWIIEIAYLMLLPLFVDNHHCHRVWWRGRAGVWFPSVCRVSWCVRVCARFCLHARCVQFYLQNTIFTKTPGILKVHMHTDPKSFHLAIIADMQIPPLFGLILTVLLFHRVGPHVLKQWNAV